MGLGLLGTAIAGGLKGAGEIADDELKNRAAASLAAQRDAAAEQRAERLGELKRELAEKQLEAQKGQWGVQNHNADINLELQREANQNTSDYQQGLLSLREREVGKQSAQEQEFASRSAWAKELSTATDPAEAARLQLIGKAQGWLTDKSNDEPLIEKKVKASDGSFITIKGTRSQIESMTTAEKPPALGDDGRFSPVETAAKMKVSTDLAEETKKSQLLDAGQEAEAVKNRRNTDPALSGMNEKESADAAFKQRAQGLLSKVGNAIIGRVSTPEDAAALVDGLRKQIQSMPKGAPERYGLQVRYEKALSDPLYQQWEKQNSGK